MNYIQEINSFYEWLESNPIPASAISLWHTLMQINNRCRWCTEFTVAISTLVSKSGASRSSVFYSRDILVAKGRLLCTSNGSKQAATYRLISLTHDAENEPDPSVKTCRRSLYEAGENLHFESNDSALKGMDSMTNCRTDVRTISKQNKTKQNINKEPKGSMSSCDDPAKLIRQIFDDFNEICRNLPTAKVLTSRRAQMVGARLHEHGYETIRQMLVKAGASNFLAGANNRKWTATFDWLFGPCNFAKVLEGNYDNGRFMKTEKSGFVGKPSPIELLEEVYNNIQEDGRLDQ